LALHAQPNLLFDQYLTDALRQFLAAVQHALAKADVNHRKFADPVPARLSHQALEQILMFLKQVFEGVKQPTFAKTARAAQKVLFACLNQIQRQARIVNLVIPLLDDLAKGLNANGQLAPFRRGNRGGGGEHRGKFGSATIKPAQHSCCRSPAADRQPRSESGTIRRLGGPGLGRLCAIGETPCLK